ncbi:MAG: hypothetical protein WA252_08720 [Candidatus Sulfotelmatobacter sp.]
MSDSCLDAYLGHGCGWFIGLGVLPRLTGKRGELSNYAYGSGQYLGNTGYDSAAPGGALRISSYNFGSG